MTSLCHTATIWGVHSNSNTNLICYQYIIPCGQQRILVCKIHIYRTPELCNDPRIHNRVLYLLYYVTLLSSSSLWPGTMILEITTECYIYFTMWHFERFLLAMTRDYPMIIESPSTAPTQLYDTVLTTAREVEAVPELLDTVTVTLYKPGWTNV